jgi:hypothetical protein
VWVLARPYRTAHLLFPRADCAVVCVRIAPAAPPPAVPCRALPCPAEFRTPPPYLTLHSAYFHYWCANQWVTACLEVMGAFVVLAVAGLGVYQHHEHSSSSGVVGLGIAYALQLPGTLMWLVRTFTAVSHPLCGSRMAAPGGIERRLWRCHVRTPLLARACATAAVDGVQAWGSAPIGW